MDFQEFQRQTEAAIHLVFDELQSIPAKEGVPVPQDLQSVLAIVRIFAGELMICADLNSAMSRQRQDQGALLCVVFVATRTADDVQKEALRRAYATMPEETTILPGAAVASFLLELCIGLENARQGSKPGSI